MNGYGTKLPYLAGCAYAMIFGLSFMFTKQALDDFPTLLLLAYRFSIASILLAILAFTGIIKLQFSGKPWKTLLLLALFQPVFYFICETLGIKLTSSSEAGIMIALIPVVVTLFAVIFIKERPTLPQYFSIAASVAGVIFIVIMSGSFRLGTHFAGMLALLGAVLSAGVFNILSRKLSQSFKPVEITFVMMCTGAFTFNGAFILQGISAGTLGKYVSAFRDPWAFVSVGYLGILSSVCAFFLVNYTLSKLSASRSTVFSNLTTVISIIAGVFVRHEPFYWYQLVGGIFIVAGVWGTNYFAKPVQTEQKEAAGA